jgi:hypothetical protein
MQIKMILRLYLILGRMAVTRKQTTNAGEAVEEKEPSYTVAGNVN